MDVGATPSGPPDFPEFNANFPAIGRFSNALSLSSTGHPGESRRCGRRTATSPPSRSSLPAPVPLNADLSSAASDPSGFACGGGVGRRRKGLRVDRGVRRGFSRRPSSSTPTRRSRHARRENEAARTGAAPCLPFGPGLSLAEPKLDHVAHEPRILSWPAGAGADCFRHRPQPASETATTAAATRRRGRRFLSSDLRVFMASLQRLYDRTIRHRRRRARFPSCRAG
jgi:hypothetical protein